MLVNSLMNIVYGKVAAERNIHDVDLINELEKSGLKVRMGDLNIVLLQLEILGLLTVRWVSKEKRRIEAAEISNSRERY